MNCLAHQAVVARSEILRRLEQDSFFVPPRVATSNLRVPSSKSCSFLSLDFKLHWSALTAEGSNTACSCLLLLERLRTPGQPLCVSAGSFVRKWSGAHPLLCLSPLCLCTWENSVCRQTIHRPGVGSVLRVGSGASAQKNIPPSPRLAIQQCGHVLSVQAAGLCSLPLPSCAVSLNSPLLGQGRSPCKPHARVPCTTWKQALGNETAKETTPVI